MDMQNLSLVVLLLLFAFLWYKETAWVYKDSRHRTHRWTGEEQELYRSLYDGDESWITTNSNDSMIP